MLLRRFRLHWGPKLLTPHILILSLPVAKRDQTQGRGRRKPNSLRPCSLKVLGMRLSTVRFPDRAFDVPGEGKGFPFDEEQPEAGGCLLGEKPFPVDLLFYCLVDLLL